jgi:uncharacterized membrane protein YhaH (DUF805 family)
MLSALKRCVSGLASFSGRDPRRVFWPYAGAVFLAYFAVNAVTTSTTMAGAMTGGVFDPRPMMAVVSVEIVDMVLALAAAVARRLRDAGLAPAWGLLPVPFLTFSLIAFNVMVGHLAGGQTQPPMGLFMGIFFSNLAYIVALVTLVVLLARRTRAVPDPETFA